MPIPSHTFESEERDPHTGFYEPWKRERVIPIVWLRKNYQRFLYHPDRIVRDAEPYSYLDGPHESGLYFLIDRGSIIYVGLSRYIRTRLAQHIDRGIEFTHYWCFGGIPPMFLEDVELFYIHALEPTFNVKYSPLHEPAVVYVKAHKAGTLAYLPEHC